MKKICLLFGILFLLCNCVLADGEVDFTSYMRELQLRLKANWNPPSVYQGRRVILLFKVAKDGALISSSIYRSSGDKDMDTAALNAVKASSPFRPLPLEFKGESIDIQFKFDYNVFANNELKFYQSLVHPFLEVTSKKYIKDYEGYRFLNAFDRFPRQNNVKYLLRVKVDCKNRLIGLKRAQAYYSNRHCDNVEFTNYLDIHENIKMQSADTNDIYLKIYNYACQP